MEAGIGNQLWFNLKARTPVNKKTLHKTIQLAAKLREGHCVYVSKV